MSRPAGGASRVLVDVHTGYMQRCWIVFPGDVGELESCHAQQPTASPPVPALPANGNAPGSVSRGQCWSRRFKACSASSKVGRIVLRSRV